MQTISDCGIYQIHNTIDGKYYVGQSVRMNSRWKQHLSKLRRNTHHCIHLQHAFNKFGEHSFTFEILEVCQQAAMTEREQFWMDSKKDSGLYNSAPSAGSPFGIKRSEVTLEKLRKARIGHFPTDETKRKIKAALLLNVEKARETSIRQFQDPIQRKKQADAKIGGKATVSTKAKLSAGLLVRWSDPEYKSRLSKSQSIVQKKLAGAASIRMREKWANPEYRKMMKEKRVSR